MEQNQKLIQAQQRVAKLKGFYGHLSVYLAVMTLLFAVNSLSPGPWWVQWPLIGWGIGVTLHALTVFGLDRFWGPDWEQKKIDEFMNRG
jgi:hypothetical protein